ncbi:MAG: hypothetical protein ACREJ3_05955 [Polyangiaceae bacterium]
MSDERPSALGDVAKGLGLLFRAARTAAKRLPHKDLEEVVMTSAREVGRALENVATTIEREVLGRKDKDSHASRPGHRSDPIDAKPQPDDAKETETGGPKPPGTA